ncbi:MAG: hypothetical protein M1822_000293 [Bathelium mastoideum]|nr:MAG: hypothetical protein M1822_000293 [Bathelium mastoideum]
MAYVNPQRRLYLWPDPDDIDQRNFVDLRVCKINPHYNDYVKSTNDIKDAFGMPQPAFHFQITSEEAERAVSTVFETCFSSGPWLARIWQAALNPKK